MRTVTIKRKKSFFGCALVWQINCDQKPIGSVRNGQTTVIEIDENTHYLQCVSITPNHISSNGDGNVYGGGGMMISDVVCIPSGNRSVNLFVEARWGSLRLIIV